MKLSRNYMKKAEFKARQLWLPFVDAVGIALEVIEPAMTAARDWFKEWKKSFVTKTPAISARAKQRFLDFGLSVIPMLRKAA